MPLPVHYPESDGAPMGETDVHITASVHLLAALRLLLARRDGFYVAANMFLYHRRGDPRARRAPDLFVVPDTEVAPRRTWKLWEERRVPALVIEITSRSTRSEDTGPKRALYERLGVREYLLFDPEGDYLDPRLQGFRLGDDGYVPMLVADERVHSEVLGAELRADGSLLRVVDPRTGRPIPTLNEMSAQLEAIEQRAARAEDELEILEHRADRAEGVVERVETELRATHARAELAERRAELAERRAELAERRVELAEAEQRALRSRAEIAEARLRALRTDDEP